MEQKFICGVCNKNEAKGVFASRIAPVSLAYCEECMSKGAEPFSVIGTRIAHLRLLGRVELSEKLKKVIEVSLPICGKSEEELQEDIQTKIEKMSKHRK